MNVRISRVDKSLPLPEYQTKGAVAFDFITRKTTVVEPKTIALVPGNLVVEIPEGYMLVVASRSSTSRRKNLFIPHGIGIIDNDHCGPEDEIKVQVYNNSDEPVTVEKGERIAQGVFVRVDKAKFVESDLSNNKTRGQFGSTGVK